MNTAVHKGLVGVCNSMGFLVIDREKSAGCDNALGILAGHTIQLRDSLSLDEKNMVLAHLVMEYLMTPEKGAHEFTEQCLEMSKRIRENHVKRSATLRAQERKEAQEKTAPVTAITESGKAIKSSPKLYHPIKENARCR